MQNQLTDFEVYCDYGLFDVYWEIRNKLFNYFNVSLLSACSMLPAENNLLLYVKH